LGAASAAVALAAIAVLVLTRHSDQAPLAGPDFGMQAAEHQEAAPGERGGEGERGGANSPAAEQVEDRAYPKSYVSDRRALRSERSFSSLPSRPSGSSFRSERDFRAAKASEPQGWKALGPVTPGVAPQATLFFNPKTGIGTQTTTSGRVTALAIDPNCGRAGRGCRLWVAAAGGGIWRTNNALAHSVKWIAPPGDLPTNSFGSLIVDPSDPSGDTLYAGSGEPNGSSDSEAGLGLFKSTDGGVSWHLVDGSRKVAIDRSIGSIVVNPHHPGTIYIGTDLARHGMASVWGGRRSPPNAPTLGVYESTDGGDHFHLLKDLQKRTPSSPVPPATGLNWFQGGINKLELDPADPGTVYAAVIGYGVWRSEDGGAHWSKVFRTLNQTNFSNPRDPGDMHGDRTEFDLVRVDHHTRAYVGDSSDDLAKAIVWKANRLDTKSPGQLVGSGDNAGWTRVSSSTNGTRGFLSYYYCQNGQCGYDDFVSSPPGHPGQLWLGGSMNYDELALSGGQPPRSNGRAVLRTTNAGAKAKAITWQDMTQDAQPPGTREGLHPDLHAIAFDPRNPDVAFVGSDGGVHRINVARTRDFSGRCASRRYRYEEVGPAEPLRPPDLRDCQRLLDGIPNRIKSLNDGLNDLQFQSLSFNPNNPTGSLLGGTQDNGTFSYTGSPAWTEAVGGDGGQSGFDSGDTTIRYHNYFDATPDVNFHAADPNHWLLIYEPLAASGESQSFYAPFIADPTVAGRAFIGLQHVWRTNDNGGDPTYLEAHCNELDFDSNRPQPCGDWQPIGGDLTSNQFGTSRRGQFVVATVRAPSDDGTLWAATRTGRLFITKNADDSTPAEVEFHRIDTPGTPRRFVSGITVDPADPNHAWISYSGYNAYTPSTPGHVFEVHADLNQQPQFTDISHNLGDQPVTGIALDPDTGDLYAATDFGVSRLPAGGTKWEDAAPGLPSVAVYGLTLSDQGRRLFAATHGRGAYALPLP
jgi:hypothetical protein